MDPIILHMHRTVPATQEHWQLRSSTEDCGFVPLNVTLPLSPGRAYNGSRPNTHVFAANTSSKLSTSQVKHKYMYRILSRKTHLYVIGLT